MANTAEFLALMAGLDDDARAALLTRHVQQHGESSMTESLRPLVERAESLETDMASPVWQGLPDGIAEAFVDGNLAHRELVVGVWNTWVDVVNEARHSGTAASRPAPSRRARSRRARSRRAPSRSAPSRSSSSASTVARSGASGATAASSTLRCPSCGVPSSGLCYRCEQREILDDHVEYDRRLYENDLDRIEHDRLRDDRHYDDTTLGYDSSYDEY
jgi:hypothetical protein